MKIILLAIILIMGLLFHYHGLYKIKNPILIFHFGFLTMGFYVLSIIVAIIILYGE